MHCNSGTLKVQIISSGGWEQLGKPIKELRTNCGRVPLLWIYRTFKWKCVLIQFDYTGTPPHNVVVERREMTLLDVVISMMSYNIAN